MDLQQRMAELDARIAARMSALNARMGLAPAPAAASPIAEPTAKPPLPSVPFDAQGSAPSFDSAVRAACCRATGRGDGQELDPMLVAKLWEPTDAEIRQLMYYVCTSSHVAGNRQYAAVADRLHFVIAREIADINAFATRGEFSQSADIPADAPMIYILGGALRYARIISAAYVMSAVIRQLDPDVENPLPYFVKAIGYWVISQKAVIPLAETARFAGKLGLHYCLADERLFRMVSSLSSGLLIGILAHEFGHLALGHVQGGSANLEVSRNQEREADSFASSVISTSPFGDYLFLGMVLWDLVWVWIEQATGVPATTHPLSSERLAALIRANPSVAADLGLIERSSVGAFGIAAARGAALPIRISWRR